jgi:hypothetical protein
MIDLNADSMSVVISFAEMLWFGGLYAATTQVPSLSSSLICSIVVAIESSNLNGMLYLIITAIPPAATLPGLFLSMIL